MNKSIDALKLALEALEQYEKAGLSTFKTIDAIVSLRETLAHAPTEREQPAQQPVSVTDELVEAYCWAWAQSFVTNNPYHTVKMTTEDRKHIAAGLRAALADQPAQQQEPVAYIKTWHKNGEQHADIWQWEGGIEALKDGNHYLYTSPPASKPWVGLTEKEVYDLADADPHGGALRLYRAIEAKLKEKNGF